MNSKVLPYYDSASGIFYKNYFGDILLENIISSWEEIIKQKLIPNHVNKFIINYKEAKILFSPDKAKEIANFYKNNDTIFAKSKIAMVMETPDQIVFPHLVELESVNFTVRAFYTLEAAKYWLQE